MIIDEKHKLRPLQVEDAQALFNILDSQRQQMRVWLPFVDKTKKMEDTQNAFASFCTPENPQFAILCQDEVVGLIGFKETDFASKKTEIGYWLSFDHQGKGLMTRAVKLLLDYAFNEKQLNRVTIKAAEQNKKSRRIPQSLGFTQEGIERDGELLVDNIYTDIVVYNLLKKEYLEQKNK